MALGIEILRFQLPGHDAATLRNMNQLRSEERFCDVTIVGDSLKFRGHKVILAACSPFLRDQFILNPTSELQVSLMHNAKIITNLLISCYTGTLEFVFPDIVNYLIAASYLQMDHVVEKCRNALHQYIEPNISLKEEMARRSRCNTNSPGYLKELEPSPKKNSLSHRAAMTRDDDLGLKLEMSEEEEDDDNYDEQEEDSVSDLCILQVENALEMSQRQKHQQQLCDWVKEAEKAGEQEESQVNSTMEGLNLEKSHHGVVKACYSFSEDADGEGLLIIPGSFHEEREAAASGEECESSISELVDALSRQGNETTKDLLRLRNPLKNMKCVKCEEVFHGVEKLVFHMRAQHFIFMCPRCGKQFNHSSNLNRHMNIHRGLKSHTCLICGKCFTQKSTLHDHMNLHSGERPYHCSYCNVRFAHKPAIRRHLKEQHGKTTAENIMEASIAEMKVQVG
ncbi:zinc finger and BTB domain-containing protein 12-like [Ambystoma mexicanum]|uniref:zinc finger and BTB domain-containing protein 12-like n=1 Tax=Ambystoma mexicanum TaxID=8296 RepID=UPI0037E8698E